MIDLSPRPTPLSKRAFDLVAAAALALAAAPLMAAVALAIAARMGRPVLFTQDRIGLGDRTFRLYKFRTMSSARDKSGQLLSDSERLTALGRLLRKTSLDELPQLWNVLKGDMSLVGPRPLFVHYLPYYTERERLRHTVRPGITGLAQVCGRNNIGWDERLELDVRYVEQWNLALDTALLIRTVVKVIARQDIAVVPGKLQGQLSAVRERQASWDTVQ